MVWPAIIAAAAALGSTALSGVMGQRQAEAQEEAANRGMDRQAVINEDMYRHRYRWTMDDMKAAGLNPIMAASSGFNVGSGPEVGLPSYAMAPPWPVADIASTAKDVVEVENIEADTEKKRKESELAVKQAQRAGAQAQESLKNVEKMEVEKGKISAEERRTVEEIRVKMREVDLLVAETEKIANQIDLISAETRLAGSRDTVAIEESRNLERQREMIGMKLAEIRAKMQELSQRSDVYKGTYGKILAYISETLKAIGSLVTGTVGGALAGSALRRGVKVRPVGSGLYD